MATGPNTLLEAVQYFADEKTCIEYLAAKRWPDADGRGKSGSQIDP